MPLTNFPNGISSMGVPVVGGGAGLGIGNVYFVVQAAQDYSSEFNRMRKTTYNDGSVNIHTSITSAVDACVSERNDYIVVFPDATDYDEDATLTLDVNSTHLICPAGMGNTIGCATRGATIDPSSAANAITITGRGVEVAGFWIRCYTEKYGFYVSASTGSYIHHNDIAVTPTTASAAGVYIRGAAAGTRVENNFIFTNTSGTTMAFGIRAENTCTRTIVRNNWISISNGVTCTYAIMTGEADVMCIIDGNIIQEVPVAGGAGAGVITNGIQAGLGSLVSNNTIAMADTGNAIGGGTATNCVNNISSLDGGTIVQ